MKYAVIVTFELPPDDKQRVFYAAHLMQSVDDDFDHATAEVVLNADTPEEALEEGMFLAWLLDKS